MSGCAYCVKCKKSKEPTQSAMCDECAKITSNFIKQTFCMDSDDLADLGVKVYQKKSSY